MVRRVYWTLMYLSILHSTQRKDSTMRRQWILALLLSTRTLAAQSTWDLFDKSQLSLQVDGETKSVDVLLKFDEDSFEIVSKKTKQPLKDYRYTDIKSAEYSYAKSPRWKTAVFVSPLFLFTSGKKHWLLTQGPSDFALLRLDKDNYKLILAAMESKTGKPIEMVADDK